MFDVIKFVSDEFLHNGIKLPEFQNFLLQFSIILKAKKILVERLNLVIQNRQNSFNFVRVQSILLPLRNHFLR